MRKVLIPLFLLASGVTLWAEPTVDGQVTSGEYAHSQPMIDGKTTVSWVQDAQGGLYVAVSAKTKGWVGVGLGARRMSGAFIYIGFVEANGKAVFSEQKGRGHVHSETPDKVVDKSKVVLKGDTTTMEFHIPAGKAPLTGKSLPFITAFGPSADLEAFHDENYDTGTLTLP